MPLCRPAFDRVAELCESPHTPEAAAVRARAGDALLFLHHAWDEAPELLADPFSEYETVRAMHASCGVQAGDKVVLAKFLRAGPKPYHDEARFLEAMDARQRQQAAPAPSPRPPGKPRSRRSTTERAGETQ